MALYPKDGPIPPGGYHFFDRSGPTEVRIDGSSLIDVAQQLLAYRLQNGRPPGNPAVEVADHICSNWPHFCHDSDQPFLDINMSNAPFANRVLDWLQRFLKSAAGDDGVSQVEADRRAAVCAACPQNVDFRRGGCGACIQSVERMAYVWLRRRQTPSDAALGGCQVLNQHNQTAVHSSKLQPPEPNLSGSLPDGCWRKA